MTDDALDTAPCGYFSFLDDGALCAVNNTLCNWLGYAKEELRGQNVESLFTLPTSIFYQTHFFPLVKLQGAAEEIFVTLRTKAGDFLPVLLNAKRDASAAPVTACAVMAVAARQKFEEELIAARKAAETALRENSALQEAQRELQNRAAQLETQYRLADAQYNELRQLNHALTHSLKEPLRKILVYTGKLKSGPLPAEAREDFGRLFASSEQMRNVVTGLQQYVWLNDAPPVFVPLALNEVLQTAATQVRQKTGGEELNLTAAGLPVIDGDKEQVELLFFHLLYNAVKFKKEGAAAVSVTASLIKQNRFTAVEGKYDYDDFVKVDVADNGIGFDPAAADRMFELFQKLNATEGTGVGLALCKKIVANHHGTITAQGSPNNGAVFTVTLPLRR